MNLKFVKKAIDLSKESLDLGKFPAGALLVREGEIVASETSSAYPHQYLHAETKIIDETAQRLDSQLDEFELYTSLEPCMMCLGKIYWSGINTVYYVLTREDVDTELSYEGNYKAKRLYESLNRKIDFIQDTTYFEEALEYYQTWDKKMKEG